MAALVELAAEFGLQLVYLFGSQMQLGKAFIAGAQVHVDDPLADLDVGVVRGEVEETTPARLELYGELSIALAELFQPFRVDLVFLDETHSVFQAEAVGGFCAYAVSSGVRDEYEMRILARCADFKPVLEMFYRERLEEL